MPPHNWSRSWHTILVIWLLSVPAGLFLTNTLIETAAININWQSFGASPPASIALYQQLDDALGIPGIGLISLLLIFMTGLFRQRLSATLFSGALLVLNILFIYGGLIASTIAYMRQPC